MVLGKRRRRSRFTAPSTSIANSQRSRDESPVPVPQRHCPSVHDLDTSLSPVGVPVQEPQISSPPHSQTPKSSSSSASSPTSSPTSTHRTSPSRNMAGSPHVFPSAPDASTSSTSDSPSAPDSNASSSSDSLENNFPVEYGEDMFDIFTMNCSHRSDTRIPVSSLGSNNSTFNTEADAVLVQMQKTMSRPTFIAILSLYGKTRYTLEHYDFLTVMMEDKENSFRLPSVSSMRNHVFPYLLRDLLVKSSIQKFQNKSAPTFSTDAEHNGTTSFGSQNEKKGSHWKNEAVVVLPSSWSTMDIGSLHILREIICLDECRCHRPLGSSDLRVDTCRRVTHSADISSHSNVLWANNSGTPFAANVGNGLRFHCPSTFSDIQHLKNHIGLAFQTRTYRRELCSSFDGTLHSTFHVISCGDQSPNLSVACPPITTPANDALSVDIYENCLAFLASLCKSTHPPDASPSDNEEARPGPRSRSRRQKSSTRRPSSRIQSSNIQTHYLLPGDHVSLITFNQPQHLIGAFVSRFWVNRVDDERNFFMFLLHSPSPASTFRFVDSLTILGAPSICSTNSPQHQAASIAHDNPKLCYTKGILASGQVYYMYRLMLYSDDFTPRSTLFPKGSVGGLYMTPCGLHMRTKRSQSSIRTLSLTPTGISTNTVIDYMHADIVDASLNGVDTKDAFGQDVKVFIDVLGFVGDYPASSSVVDVSGHTANSPCTHCTFHVNRHTGSSAYAYTTSITSSNSTFRRSQIRTKSIRKVKLASRQRKLLGLKEFIDDTNQTTSPGTLLALASLYNYARDRLDSTEDHPIACHAKDGYDMNIVAPDHLLTGLFKGVLTCTFLQLGTTDHDGQLQAILKENLSTFGHQTQSRIFLRKKGKLVPGLSMSMLYSLLTCLSTSLKALNILDSVPTSKLIINLYRFTSLALWWPTIQVDGSQSWSLVHGDGMSYYHTCLHTLASNYVKSVDTYCKQYPQFANNVDRPNVHRLLELTAHTVPQYSHLTNVCELVFESAHQPLKFYLSRNHTIRSHIYSTHLILARDWLVRLWSLWSIHNSSTESTESRKYALIGMVRLLAGQSASSIDWASGANSTQLEQLRQHIHNLMAVKAEKCFRKWYGVPTGSYNNNAFWEVLPIMKVSAIDPAIITYLKCSLYRLCTLTTLVEAEGSLGLTSIFRRGYGSTSISPHERIRTGDVIQVLLLPTWKEMKFVDRAHSESGNPTFFVVGGFFSFNIGDWAVVKPCQLDSSSPHPQLPDSNFPGYLLCSTHNFYTTTTDSFEYYVRLSPYIRKVGFVHNCSDNSACHFCVNSYTVQHSVTTLQGGSFFLLPRSMGYPPRRS